jgi:methylmalonyl-CoA decarboxylase
MSRVNLNVAGAVATVELCHPERRNALSRALLDDLTAAIDESMRQRIRVVILRAPTGATVWSSGHDVEEIPPHGSDPLEWDNPLRKFVRKIEELPVPVIAMIEGSVWGGACEVVFACDIALATPATTLALTPARLGVPYNVGGMLNLLNTASPKLAREMAFTAKPVPAERLAQLGLVNHVVAADQIESAAQRVAQDIAANSPLAIAAMKEQLRALSSARALSPETFERIQSLRRIAYTSRDYLEGIAAFKEKRAPEFKGE